MSNDMKVINYLEAGLKSEGLKQQTIASNVANMKTPGYRRVDVNFDKVLEMAIEKDKPVDQNQIENSVYNPKNTPLNSNGNDVSLDQEVGEMVKNTLRHRTFTLLLKKKYGQLNAAMRTSG